MRRPGGVEGIGQQGEVALQLLGGAVAGRIGPDACPHEADFQAERLVRIAAVALERDPQLGRDGRQPLRYGQPRRQVRERLRIVVEHRPPGAPRRGERDLRGDERVAIPIAPDPAPQRERRHRSGAKPAPELVLERFHQPLAHARRRFQETIFQVPQRVRHLVHDRGAVTPDFLGQPEQLHLALQVPLDGPTLGLGCAVAREQPLRQARLQVEDGAARGLRGMGREDRSDIERRQGARHLLGAAAGLAQAAQRPAHRSALRRGEVVLARAPHPVGLLRRVDQDEEHREGTGREPRGLGSERAGPRQQRVQIGCPGDAQPARATGASQLFDRPERVLSRQPAHHPSQRRREPAHVLTQRPVLGPRYGRRGGNAGGEVGRRHP